MYFKLQGRFNFYFIFVSLGDPSVTKLVFLVRRCYNSLFWVVLLGLRLCDKIATLYFGLFFIGFDCVIKSRLPILGYFDRFRSCDKITTPYSGLFFIGFDQGRKSQLSVLSCFWSDLAIRVCHNSLFWVVFLSELVIRVCHNSLF